MGNRFNQQSDLKVGLGFRVQHLDHILSHEPDVHWFEIISENYMLEGGRPRFVLEKLLERYPVVLHGVGLYIGSAQGVDREHLERVKSLVRKTKTPWVTDHLCWGSVDGKFSHDLLPLPYTWEAVNVAVENIQLVQKTLNVPFCIENVSSYAEFRESEMTEWEFLSEVSERADVGILLDVNNIFVSSYNHRFDPHTYLKNIPHDRVAQIHIAGHSQHDDFIIDTHDHPVIDPVWKLYAQALEICGPTPTLLEWDAKIPSFHEVHEEARKAMKYWKSESREVHYAG